MAPMHPVPGAWLDEFDEFFDNQSSSGPSEQSGNSDFSQARGPHEPASREPATSVSTAEVMDQPTQDGNHETDQNLGNPQPNPQSQQEGTLVQQDEVWIGQLDFDKLNKKSLIIVFPNNNVVAFANKGESTPQKFLLLRPGCWEVPLTCDCRLRRHECEATRNEYMGYKEFCDGMPIKVEDEDRCSPCFLIKRGRDCEPLIYRELPGTGGLQLWYHPEVEDDWLEIFHGLKSPADWDKVRSDMEAGEGEWILAVL